MKQFIFSAFVALFAMTAAAADNQRTPATTQPVREPIHAAVRVLDAPLSAAFDPKAKLVPSEPRVALPTLEAAAIEQAKIWQTTGTAKPILGDDGVILYPFGQYMPVMVCAILRSCVIDLEPGEVVTGIKPGDKVRWKFSQVKSGAGETEQAHIVVKPVDEGIETNVAVSTNRRLYDILLRSEKGGSSTFIHRMGFYYPADLVGEWQAADQAQKTRDAEVIDTIGMVDPAKLNFRYSWKSNRYAKRQPMSPIRVFDNGSQTYIQMDPKIRSYEAPALMVKSASGEWQIVNYRVIHDYYKVDRLFEDALLVIGQGRKAAKVEIHQGE